MLDDHRKAIRPTNPGDVSLIEVPEPITPHDQYGVIEWRAAWTDGRWPVASWNPSVSEPGLFYKLAREVDVQTRDPQTRETALAAFRKYGPLLHDHEETFRALERGKGFILEERVYDWGYHTLRMRYARDLFRALDDARLGAYEKLAALGFATTTTPNESIRQAEQSLIASINDALRQSVYLALEPLSDSGEIVQDNGARITFGHEPRNLLGSAWLMFAREVVGETVILECPNCHKYYHKTKRNQVYCSDKCRNDAWVRENRKSKKREGE